MLFCLNILPSLNERFAVTVSTASSLFHCGQVWQVPERQLWEAGASKGWAPSKGIFSPWKSQKTWHHARKRNSSDSSAAGSSLVMCRELILWGSPCTRDITWTGSRKQMLAHSSWSACPAESLEMNRALGWKCPYLPAAQAHQLGFILKQKSSFVLWELGRMPPSLKKLVSQTKYHEQVRKNLLGLPYFAWNCNWSFPLMLYLWKSQMNFSCWTATREFKVLN